MDNNYSFIKSLGGLHDARMLKLSWCEAQERFEFEVDDIYANSYGLPGSKEPQSATFIFSKVTVVELEANFAVEGLTIYDWILDETASKCRYIISFFPGGRLVVECDGLECVTREEGNQ